ncbi:MAG: hypothetical protein AAF922_10145 [Pseudomonadota bacterium]
MLHLTKHVTVPLVHARKLSQSDTYINRMDFLVAGTRDLSIFGKMKGRVTGVLSGSVFSGRFLIVSAGDRFELSTRGAFA